MLPRPLLDRAYTDEEFDAIVAAVEDAAPSLQPVEVKPKNISADIASKHVTEERPVKELVPMEYHDLLEVFDDKAPDQLPPHREWDIAIDFKPDAKLPKAAGLYPMSDSENKELKEWLDEMQKKEFIRPSKSPVASPCFFVPKKDGAH